jgi:hypothetical protein
MICMYVCMYSKTVQVLLLPIGVSISKESFEF